MDAALGDAKDTSELVACADCVGAVDGPGPASGVTATVGSSPVILPDIGSLQNTTPLSGSGLGII
jgi:hypothetical protein